MQDFAVNLTDVPIPVHNLKFILLIDFIVPKTDKKILTYIEGRIQPITKRQLRSKSARKRGKSITLKMK